ncbi:MAG: DUF1684 domain-containing protein [Anaerolineales bacterium]|nr:DUF1684 domain-containing protein [Anaerolineales bacterium]
MQLNAYPQLVDYRQQVYDIYSCVRDPSVPPKERRLRFRSDLDHLFKNHPQTALTPEQVLKFSSLPYFPYDPAYRFLLPIEPLKGQEKVTINLQDDGPTLLIPFGQVSFALSGEPVCLTLYWIRAYGGGIFLPFEDSTNGNETYSGGRYLLDTLKGADLGREGDRLVIDFNFAYNPSCAYNSRWHCPLPPPDNQLAVPIPAGEKSFD